MKSRLNKKQNKNNGGAVKYFDNLVQKLKSELNRGGCCSNQNACDLRCNPLKDGSNSNEENGCC